MTDSPDSGAPSTDTPANRVMATFSHELRTPLNGIIGTASLLADTRLTAAQSSYVSAIRQSAAQLLDLLNNALDFARLAEGRLDLDIGAVRPADLAQDVAELLAPRAHGKGIELAVRELPGAPQAVRADGTRLRQILFNLVGNAIKFTDTGGVLVEIGPTRGEGLSLTVRDSGPGIPETVQAHLFEAFSQAQASDANRDSGVGLGLAIVDMLARAMGATVSVVSRPGEGASFRFDLPCPAEGRSPAPALAPHTVAMAGLGAVSTLAVEGVIARAGARALVLEKGGLPPEGAVTLADARVSQSWMKRLAETGPVLVLLRPEDRSLIPAFRARGCTGYLVRPVRAASLAERLSASHGNAGRRGEDEGLEGVDRVDAAALVADDNAINSLIARRALESAGFRVTLASTGSEAVDLATSQDFDLVLMDLRMPILDGFDAMKAIRGAGLTRLPILAISAEVDPDIERRARDAGASAVAAKPLDADTLRRMALKWVIRARGKAA